MKLSLKVEYACQVLAQLGYSQGRTELPHIEDLARAESIPSNYLVQILNELRTAGLITSRRGKQGGYALARPPQEISFLDVLIAVEGEALGCSTSGIGHSAARNRKAWEQVARQFEDLLRQHTIAHLMTHDNREMYYI